MPGVDSNPHAAFAQEDLKSSAWRQSGAIRRIVVGPSHAPLRDLGCAKWHCARLGWATPVLGEFEGYFEPLTARQHERLGRRNKPALWRGISHREISIERGVEAKLAAGWQSMPDLRRDSAMMAREKAAAGELCLIACFCSGHRVRSWPRPWKC